MTKEYITYAQFYEFGKPVGRKYIVRIDAESEAQAIRKAKAYHAAWSRGKKGYSAKYIGIKRKIAVKKRRRVRITKPPTYLQQVNRMFR